MESFNKQPGEMGEQPAKKEQTLEEFEKALLERGAKFEEEMKLVKEAEKTETKKEGGIKPSAEGLPEKPKELEESVQKAINSINFELEKIVAFAGKDRSDIPPELSDRIREDMRKIIKEEIQEKDIKSAQGRADVLENIEAPAAGEKLLREIKGQEIFSLKQQGLI